METKQGHTPDYWSGKWTMSDQGQVLRESDGRTVAVVYTDEKDTMLIAAAPELLEALEDFMQVVIDTYMNEETGETCIMDAGYFNTAVDRARAAIRKAKEG